jgi:hypothetical protein
MVSSPCRVVKHLFSRWPPKSYVAIVPNMIIMKKNSTMTSNIIGSEFRIVDTKLLMFGI